MIPICDDRTTREPARALGMRRPGRRARGDPSDLTDAQCRGGPQREHPGRAKQVGIAVNARGRIPASVAEQYQAATKGR
jgi:hypothetical protein